jgi:phosphopantetheinyl transferase
VTDAAALAGCIVRRFDSPAATVFECRQAALLDDWPAYWAVLDDGERARAERFVVDHVKRRFVLSHAALRLILAQRLGGDWRDIRYDTVANGKPCLAGSAAGRPEFNMSHSGDLMVVALSDDRPVGIDVEAWRPIDRVRGLAETILAARELAVFDGLSPDEASRVLLRLWTFKEALVKALGLGLSVEPRSIALPDSLLGGNPGGELLFRGTNWRLHDLGASGYAAALAHPA